MSESHTLAKGSLKGFGGHESNFYQKNVGRFDRFLWMVFDNQDRVEVEDSSEEVRNWLEYYRGGQVDDRLKLRLISKSSELLYSGLTVTVDK